MGSGLIMVDAVVKRPRLINESTRHRPEWMVIYPVVGLGWVRVVMIW